MDFSNFDSGLLATDISTRVLEIASQGIYSIERIHDIPPEMARAYFIPNNFTHHRMLLCQGLGPVLTGERSLMAIDTQQMINKGAAHFHAAIRNFAYSKRMRLHDSYDGWKSSEAIDLGFQRAFSYGRGNVVLPYD